MNRWRSFELLHRFTAQLVKVAPPLAYDKQQSVFGRGKYGVPTGSAWMYPI